MTPLVKIRGAMIAFDRSGEGPTFVWGHGLTSSRAGEDQLAMIDWTVLRSKADVVRYDARGHGESSLTGDLDAYGWDELAGDQLGLCDELGIQRAVFGGASMGAATALHAAVLAPDRVSALVLVIPPTAWETRAGQVDLYRQMADVIEAAGPEPVITAGADVPSPDPFVPAPGEVDEWKGRRAVTLRTTEPERLARIFRGAAQADFPTREAISAISCPTLILAWSGDPGHPVSSAEQLHDLIGGSSLSVASTKGELATWTGRVADFVSNR